MQLNEFSFDSIESSRFFISCATEFHSILPEQRQFTVEIPGLDGVHDFNIGGYGTRVITKAIYFDGPFSFLREHKDEIAAWLSNDGRYKKLVFGDAPDKYYIAKVIAALEFQNASNRKIGTVQFVCNPPWAYSDKGVALTPEYYALINSAVDNNQFIMEIGKTPSTMKIYNVGSAIKPIIKLIGYNPNKAQIIFNDEEISFDGNVDTYDGIVIDCESETVTRMSDAENMYPLMQGDYITLPHGYSELIFARAGEGDYPKSLTAIVEFTPKYGG